jgi:transcriptional regulator with XRE-family HTH domain
VGEVLARLRRAAGLTGTDLGRAAGISQAKVSRIETNAIAADPRDVLALARALGLPPADERRLVDRATRAQDRMTDWRPVPQDLADRQREMGQMEVKTREFRVFQPTVIIGLLQTSEYMRMLLNRIQLELVPSTADEPSGVVSEAVSARVRRHEVLADRRKHFHFLMTEAVLSNRVCRPIDMLAQIERLREVAAQDNVTVGIIPADVTWPIPPYHGFELLDDTVVTVDLFSTTLMSRDRMDIAFYQQVFDDLEDLGSAEIDPILDRYLEIYLDLSRPRRGS